MSKKMNSRRREKCESWATVVLRDITAVQAIDLIKNVYVAERTLEEEKRKGQS